ncbi:type II toxin-antitoxin system VapB family antitoxin [Nocardia sp. CDC153]|uniref:type II toxin-antitoxin system VapB family antitoxin n=1 Tax=Nocardia sp. CDC153 TaxID=3112167 RepID=UPI003FA360B9
MLDMYIANIEEILMTVTQIDLDDDALVEAMRLMGTKTKKDTVNQALRDYISRVRRVEAAQRLFERGQRGDFDQAAAAYEAEKAARREVFGE